MEDALVSPKADFLPPAPPFPGSLLRVKRPVHCPLTADAYRAGGGIVFQLVALENPATFLLKLNGFIFFPCMNNSPKERPKKSTRLTTPVRPTCSSSRARSFAQEGPLGAEGGKGEGGSSTSPSRIVIKFYFILPRHAKYRAKKYKFK